MHGAEPQPASFDVQLNLPEADDLSLRDAATSVRQEYRVCSSWKRLRCRQVSLFAERDRGVIYALHLGRSVEFDWTWEGAVAFRPESLDHDQLHDNNQDENPTSRDDVRWAGEIVEVDEQNGCLFISLETPELTPTVGSFFVRPFEFLATINAVYNEPRFEAARKILPQRLAATEGGIHPAVCGITRSGLPPLQHWWQHSWSILWGPPGTGKTYITGQQVAAVMADPSERILVVSTTNRATDAAALSIGNAARSVATDLLESGKLLRIGKGALPAAFDHNRCPMMFSQNSDACIPMFAKWFLIFSTMSS